MKPVERRSQWARDLFVVKQYGEDGPVRLVQHKGRVRVSGWEPGAYNWRPGTGLPGKPPENNLWLWLKVCTLAPQAKEPRRAEGGPRLPSSLSRTRSRVFELARCNHWDWFVTLTLDGQKWDRRALSAWRKSLAQWLRDYRKRTGAQIAYLLLPEQHRDGAWHIHGLLSGIPAGDVERFTWDQVRAGMCPARLVRGGYYNWPRFAAKYGYCSLGRVRSQEKTASYVTKYITKDLARLAAESGCNLYYCSQGLKRAEVIFRGALDCREPALKWDWGDDNPNAWVRLKTYASVAAFLREWMLPEEAACAAAAEKEAWEEDEADPPFPSEGHWSYHFSDCQARAPRRVAGPSAGPGKEWIQVEKRLHTASRIAAHSVTVDRTEPVGLRDFPVYRLADRGRAVLEGRPGKGKVYHPGGEDGETACCPLVP